MPSHLETTMVDTQGRILLNDFWALASDNTIDVQRNKAAKFINKSFSPKESRKPVHRPIPHSLSPVPLDFTPQLCPVICCPSRHGKEAQDWTTPRRLAHGQVGVPGSAAVVVGWLLPHLPSLPAYHYQDRTMLRLVPPDLQRPRLPMNRTTPTSPHTKRRRSPLHHASLDGSVIPLEAGAPLGTWRQTGQQTLPKRRAKTVQTATGRGPRSPLAETTYPPLLPLPPSLSPHTHTTTTSVAILAQGVWLVC